MASPKPKPKSTKSPSFYVGPTAAELAKATKKHINDLAKKNQLGRGIR
jgi:hypothetical protein